jgi:hypothetical protein
MPILPGCVGETYVGVVCSHPERLSVVVLDSILPSGAEERFASEFLRSWIPAIENTSGWRVVASASLAVPVPVPGSQFPQVGGDVERWAVGGGRCIGTLFSVRATVSFCFSRSRRVRQSLRNSAVESPSPSVALIPPASVIRATIAPAGVTTAQIPTASDSFASAFPAQVSQPYGPATTVRTAIAPLSTSGRAASPADPSAMARSVAKLTETGTAGLDRPVIELGTGTEVGRSREIPQPRCPIPAASRRPWDSLSRNRGSSVPAIGCWIFPFPHSVSKPWRGCPRFSFESGPLTTAAPRRSLIAIRSRGVPASSPAASPRFAQTVRRSKRSSKRSVRATHHSRFIIVSSSGAPWRWKEGQTRKPHEPKSSFNSVFHATKTVRSSRRLPRVRRVSSRCAASRNVSSSLRATAAWSGSSPRSIAPLVTAHRTPRSGGTGMVDAELDNVRLLGRRIAMSIVVDT